MQYSTYCNLAGKPQGKPISLPTMDDITAKIESILDYEFESFSLCRDALVAGKKQTALANTASLPAFGSRDVLAAAAKESGIASLFRVSKKGGVVSDEQLATTVTALLGAVMEDIQDENYVLRAAYNLGLEAMVDEDEVQEVSAAPVVDLLGVEEFAFVQSATSVPVAESLI